MLSRRKFLENTVAASAVEMGSGVTGFADTHDIETIIVYQPEKSDVDDRHVDFQPCQAS